MGKSFLYSKAVRTISPLSFRVPFWQWNNWYCFIYCKSPYCPFSQEIKSLLIQVFNHNVNEVCIYLSLFHTICIYLLLYFDSIIHYYSPNNVDSCTSNQTLLWYPVSYWSTKLGRLYVGFTKPHTVESWISSWTIALQWSSANKPILGINKKWS